MKASLFIRAFGFLFIATTSSLALGGTWYVETTGSDTTGTGTKTAPFATVHKAIESAVDGDEIFVGAGTYYLTQQIDILKAITVTGAGRDETIFNGSKLSGVRGMRLYRTSGAGGALARNFTLMGCTNSIAVNGSAIYIDFNGGVADNIRVTQNKRTDGADGGVVHILTGTLKNSLIDRNAVVRSDDSVQYGAGVTLGSNWSDYAPVVTNCVVAFNVAENSLNYIYGVGVSVLDGTLIDCKIYGNSAEGDFAAYGVGAHVGNGTIVDCEIYENTVRHSYLSHKGYGLYVNNVSANASAVAEGCHIHSNKGTGVYLASGIVTNSLVESHVATGTQIAHGIGVYQVGGTFVDCEVRGNSAEDRTVAHEGYGLYLNGTSAVAERCRIHSNEGNGVYVENGTLRNSLVCKNESLASMPGGLRQARGTVINCTFVDNESTSPASQDCYVAEQEADRGSCTLMNCIAENAKVEDGYFEGVFQNNLVVNPTGTAISEEKGNILNVEPKFVTTTGEKAYRLRGTSPAINAGANSIWSDIANPLDLAGFARINGENVDLGCYEYQPNKGGLRIIVR